MYVVFYQSVDECGLLEEVVLAEGVQLVELNSIYAHLGVDGCLEQIMFFAFIGDDLQAAVLDVVKFIATELLYELLAVWFNFALCSQLQGATLCSHVGIAQIIV